MPSRSDFQWIFACNRSACLNCYRKISSMRWKNGIKYVKLILLRSRRQQNYRLCETGELHQKAGQKQNVQPALKMRQKQEAVPARQDRNEKPGQMESGKE